MEQQQPGSAEHLPPPLGANYELPPTLMELLRTHYDENPAFINWAITFSKKTVDDIARSQPAISKGPLREKIVAGLIEAYDQAKAKAERDYLRQLYDQPTIPNQR